MKPRFVIAVILVLALAIPAQMVAQSATAGNTIGTVKEIYDGALYPDIQVRTFRNSERLFSTRTVKHGASVYPLPQSNAPMTGITFTSEGKKYDMYDYMSLNRVVGLLILKDGKIVFERYELGNTETTRWISMSMVKGITSTLVAAAINDGYIKSIDDRITQYLPEMAGSGYDGVTVRNLMQMASGVRWDETYTDPASDRRRMLDAHLAGNHAQIIDILKKLPRISQPGTIYNYSAGDTQIVAELIHAAVKKPLAEYLSEKVWAKFGMESDALWWLDSPNGREMGGFGFVATLRDYGRFAQFVVNGGVVQGEKIVPDWWFAEAGTDKVIGGKKVGYGYFWYMPNTVANPVHEPAFLGRGIFGQRMYINPKEKVAVVVLSARPKPTGASANTINDEDFFAAVVKALR